LTNNTRRLRRLLAGASLAAIGASIAGAALAQTTGAETTSVRGVTVTAPQVVETAPVVPPLQAAYTESTITAEQVRDVSTGAQVSIQTMLNDQPSIFAYTNGPLGVGTDINFRAFNSGQFAETYDGIALNDLFNAGVTGEGVADNQNNVLLLPANIDSVQIYRGINNPATNSYNSLGGTINFLPKLPDHTASVDVGASFGSFDTTLAHVTANTGDIYGIRQMLSYNYGNSEGWEPGTGDRNNNLYYSSAYTAPNEDQLNLILVYNQNDGHTPFQMPLALLSQNGGFYQWPSNVAYENDRDTSMLGIIDFRADLSPNVTFDNKFFSGFNNYLRTSYANPAYSDSATQPYELPSQAENYDFWLYYPAGPTYDPETAFGSKEAGNAYHFYGYTTWGAGYTPTLTLSVPYNTITVGGNVTFGELHSREYWYGAYDMPQTPGYNDAWDEHDQRVFASVYVQDEIDLLDKRLSITPGVKYIYAWTTDTDAIGFFYPYGGSNSSGNAFVSPTLGVNYKITDTLAVYGAFGQNVKFPDITAYYDAIPGTTAATPPKTPPVTVKPEYVDDYELGVRYQQGGFSGSLAYYREDFTNIFIDKFDPVTYLTTLSNGGAAEYQGVELQLRNDFGAQPWGDVKGMLNFAYNQAEYTSSFISDFIGGQGNNQEADTLVTAGEPLANVPDILVSGDVNWTYQGWRADVNVRYVGTQYTDNDGNGKTSNSQTPSYVIVDLGFAKTLEFNGFNGAKDTVKFSLNFDNLFNEYYYNEEYTNFYGEYGGGSPLVASPGAPRSISGGVDVKF
jgi:outer membrane receptor protein involved in Fe transport